MQYKMIGNERVPLTKKEIDEMAIESAISEKEIALESIKSKKKEDILKIASEIDQLNLMAECIYILTKDSTDNFLLEARDKFNDIKNILNK